MNPIKASRIKPGAGEGTRPVESDLDRPPVAMWWWLLFISGSVDCVHLESAGTSSMNGTGLDLWAMDFLGDDVEAPAFLCSSKDFGNVDWDSWIRWTATAAVLSFFVCYYYLLLPMDLKRDLSDVGFDYLTDGYYKSARHRKNNKRELVREVQRLRKIGDLPPAYPNGWFPLMESADLKKNEVKDVVALGEHFAVFRNSEGKVQILDAYCPHLGANMAIGGSVHGNCLECPFHSWRFDGDSGKCINIPYAEKVPGFIEVKKWPSVEVNDLIFVWYHAEGEKPTWYPQDLDAIKSRRWPCHGRSEFLVGCHIQDVSENGGDIAHLNAIHAPNLLGGHDLRFCERFFFKFLRHIWRGEWQPNAAEVHKGHMSLSLDTRLLDKFSVGKMDVQVVQVGPAYAELQVESSWGPMIILQAVTPVEPMLQKVINRIYAPRRNFITAKLMLYGELIMFERDIMVWNHKKYLSKPQLVKEEKALVRHRRWYAQFYSENSPKVSFRKETLDWLMAMGEKALMALAEPDVNAISVGRVDWSPLAKATGTHPIVSKYGLPRYSPMEWRLANDAVTGELPSAAALDNESKNIISQISSACDKDQSENTLRLRQRAVDISVKHIIASGCCEDLKNEVDQMAQYKLRMRKALEYLGIVEQINEECREIRKNRFTEDLVRDVVEEELFQEKGLCREIRELYMATLNEFEQQYKADKKCYQEIHSIWSDQKETLEQEADNIGLKSSSREISFVHGIARLDENMSSLEIWNSYMTSVLQNIRDVIENSKALRNRIHAQILKDSAMDLKKQDEKVLKAFLRRIEDTTNARKRLEGDLDQVLKEIAHAEGLYAALEKLGRQVDFSLKVVQTRLENRRHRPGAENCRDAPQMGLMQEMKTISERVTSLETQMKKINDALEALYSTRKKLEKQIHVKRHTLNLDQERCMRYRSKYPNIAYLMGL